MSRSSRRGDHARPRGHARAHWLRGLVGLTLVALAGCSARSGFPARIVTGYISHVVCSYVFVSGLDPARVAEEDVAANPVFRGFHWAFSHHVDRDKREVSAWTIGGLESRAVYREGLGCLNLNGSPAPAAPTRAELDGDGGAVADPSGSAVVTPTSPGLATALDAAFAEPEGQAVRRTHAIVVAHNGRLVAERYAPGFGIDTPLHGWSATKSINNALLGIVVRQGLLQMDAPAPVAAWQGATDPRRAITPDHLLRMESGLALGDSLTASLSSSWDTSARMMFNEGDMAGFATGAALQVAPGARWKYANGNSAILARLMRDRVGGRAADVVRFARRELFEPLGIRRAVLETDATGTPIAGAFGFMTAREWARFGMLFLDDGVVGGRRILPEGWVQDSTTPTANASVGYGAGWWINEGESQGARFRRQHGMPADAFMALGIYGQTVVVVPSARLVIARFGTTYDLPLAMIDICRLTAAVVADVKAARH
ncbi:MAG TPA: serine hydrolase [Methylomirabilota bacterium]|nr:serine hydrolase [Methylomirabilota bacterium]